MIVGGEQVEGTEPPKSDDPVDDEPTWKDLSSLSALVWNDKE
jgi:hypothetical protein